MSNGVVVLEKVGGLLASVIEQAIFNFAVEPVKKHVCKWEASVRSFRGRARVVGGKELFFKFIGLLLGEAPVVINRGSRSGRGCGGGCGGRSRGLQCGDGRERMI
jgi:hypothetical protein